MAIAALLANGRLSEKSAGGYRAFRCLAAPMLQCLDVVAVQHSLDGERFRELGVPEQPLEATGSIKFDIQLSNTLRERAVRLTDAPVPVVEKRD